NRFQYEGSKGIYDPIFRTEYAHFENTTEGRFNQTTGVTGGSSTAKADTVTPEFSGYLPTGLKYDIGSTFAHSEGSSKDGGFDEWSSDVSFQLEQPLLRDFWIDAPRTAIKINRKNIEIAELSLEQEIRTVVRDVQLAYSEVLFSLEDVKVQEKALE